MKAWKNQLDFDDSTARRRTSNKGARGAAAAIFFLLFLLTLSAEAVSSAELYHNTPFRYGRFEARVQFPPGDGIVGSFFLWKSGSEMANVFWNELDFEKVEGECLLSLNNLYGLPETSHVTHPEGLGDLCGSYHTYTFEWTPTYIAWFVDGIELRRDVGEGVQVYEEHAQDGMVMDFNAWPGTVAFGGDFQPEILPVHEFVSYVAYSEYTPGAGDEGSDFSLLFRESFESGIPTGWGRGSWDSPLGQSTHAPENVAVQQGTLVLSVTSDDARGFSGEVPVDPADLPSWFRDEVESGTGGGGPEGTGGGASAGGTGEQPPNPEQPIDSSMDEEESSGEGSPSNGTGGSCSWGGSAPVRRPTIPGFVLWVFLGAASGRLGRRARSTPAGGIRFKKTKAAVP